MKTQFVKKGDIITIVVTVFITAVLFVFSFIPYDNLKAYIYEDGSLIYEVDFKNVKTPYTVKAGKCEIEISSDGVSFKNGNCPDKLCEKSGKLYSNCATAACVPNKVVVLVKKSKNQNDAVTY